MVLVSSLVMHPGERIAIFFSFLFVGTFSTNVIFSTRNELGKRIFRKIVKKPLKAYSAFKAMTDNGMSVLGYGIEMFERM